MPRKKVKIKQKVAHEAFSYFFSLSLSLSKKYRGPEYSVKEIFAKARLMSPCYLILEDLDSLIKDEVRSYFLNEVDGLKANDGIFMVGSTNHLERLDEGISVSFFFFSFFFAAIFVFILFSCLPPNTL